MTVAIRDATNDDLPALVRLNAQVQRLHAQIYPADFKLPTDEGDVQAFFHSVIHRAEYAIILAQIDSAIVGYAWIEIMDRPDTPFTWRKRRVFLHHLCVDSDHRRLGVGSALITRIEERAVAAGIGEFALDMWSMNDSALAFFRSRGLNTYRLFLRKQVLPGSSD